MKIQKPILRLCLKAVCLYEALSQTSYQSIDLEREQDRLHLLYAMYMAEPSNRPVSLETFGLMLESEGLASYLVKEAITALQTEAILGGVGTTEDAHNSTPQAEPSSSCTEHCPEAQSLAHLSPLVSRLIIEGGLGAHYVMYQMNLWELPIHLKALEAHRQEQMERERLWTYLGLSPYLDPSKVKSPRDFLPLPHELEEIEEERQAEQMDLALLFGLQGNTEGEA